MSVTKPINRVHPIIEFLEPDVISTNGDDFIIFGKNFQQKARVLIDDVLVYSSQLNSDAIYVRCLPFHCGVFLLVVTNPDGNGASVSLPVVSCMEESIEVLASTETVQESKPLPSPPIILDLTLD